MSVFQYFFYCFLHSVCMCVYAFLSTLGRYAQRTSLSLANMIPLLMVNWIQNKLQRLSACDTCDMCAQTHHQTLLFHPTWDVYRIWQTKAHSIGKSVLFVATNWYNSNKKCARNVINSAANFGRWISDRIQSQISISFPKRNGWCR